MEKICTPNFQTDATSLHPCCIPNYIGICVANLQCVLRGHPYRLQGCRIKTTKDRAFTQINLLTLSSQSRTPSPSHTTDSRAVCRYILTPLTTTLKHSVDFNCSTATNYLQK